MDQGSNLPTEDWSLGKREHPPSVTLTAGDELDNRYRIESFIARGGMGEVYRALDLDLGVPVALKTIRSELASDPAAVRRFKQEILLARSVSHPNVCRIHDLGRDTGKRVSFLTMEYLPGETLGSRITSKGALDPDVALPLVRQLGDALDAAHRAGVVHRDFKSQNVMLVPADDGERAVITDFGLAMAIEYDESVAADGGNPDLVGTPAYMSPEQVTGDDVGPASDLYALGVVLFEMSTAQLPFRGATAMAVARARLTADPPAPSSLAPVHPDWERTILRLLAKDPQERHRSALDVTLALEGRFSGEDDAEYALPAERNAFVGRSSELQQLRAHLEGGETDRSHSRPPATAGAAAHLVTITGHGGTGKTRLAQRYGWDSLVRWPGGVWFCDLSEARTLDGIALAVATALNVPLGKDDPIVQLGHALAGRGQALIILDNFEHVVKHVEATLGRWLQRATEARFLVTSRERLRLPGETTHELEPLDPRTQGVELFVVRAREHQPEFSVGASEQRLIEEIVERLEGLPLPIELAASRLRMLSLGGLADRLGDRLRVLSGGARGRHATLRATLDWSWELLESWERAAVAQVSVFEGGFTLDAAEGILDLSGSLEAPSVLDVVQSLVDKSWLRTRVSQGAPRFDMYATLREYASERLRAATSDASAGHTSQGAMETRHGHYYARMGTPEAIAALDRHGGVPKRAALAAELDNLVAACRRAVDRADAGTAAGTFAACWQVLALTGPVVTAVELARQVQEIPGLEATDRGHLLRDLSAALNVIGETDQARQLADELLTTLREAGGQVEEAIALIRMAELHRDQGEMEMALTSYDNALAIYREIGDRGYEGVVLDKLGDFLHDLGRPDDARRHHEDALTIHRDVGNRRYEGIALRALGFVDSEQGRAEGARRNYEQALAIQREVGNRASVGNILGTLGLLDATQGWLQEGQRHQDEALRIHRDMGDRAAEGTTLGNLGILHARAGRMDTAQRHFEDALTIQREIGNRRGEGLILGNLGNLERMRGKQGEARTHYEAALAIYQETGARALAGSVLGNLGNVHHALGRVEEAERYCEEALAIHREVGDRRAEGVVLGNLGNLRLSQGRMDEAREHYEAAIAIQREIGNRPSEGLAQARLGNLLGEQGRLDDARPHLEEGIAILREVGHPHELVNLLCVRGEHERRQGDLAAARATLREADTIAETIPLAADSEVGQELGRLREALSGEEA